MGGGRADGGSLPLENMTFAQILLIVALIGLTIVRRMAGQPLRQGRLVVLPLIFVVWGVFQVSDAHPSVTDVVLLVVETAISIGIGAVRGTTINLFVRDGYLWMRYRWSTLALWLLSAAIRVGFLVGAAELGSGPAGQASLLLGLGAGLLGESLVLAPRARTVGAPFAPRGSRRTRLPAR